MNIQNIETILTSPGRNYLIVKIETDTGIVGYGDATLNGRELVVKSFIDNYLSDWLKGYDADRIEDIWQMIYRGSYWKGGPVWMTALSGIDMALWDIKGKKFDAPLYSILGGKVRDKLNIYYHAHGSTTEELVNSCKNTNSEYIRYSFDTINPFDEDETFYQPYQNLKRGRIEVDNLEDSKKWDSDIYLNDLIKKTKVIREELGDNVKLIHDVHGRLSTNQAVKAAKSLEQFNLFFLEDTVGYRNHNALKLIKNNSSTPIAIGELFNTIHDCKDIISNQLVDFIRVDISHFGGITQVMKLAAFANVYGVKLALHGPSDISPISHNAMAHINLSIPNFGIQEYVEFDKEVKNVFNSTLTLEDQYLTLPDSPGIGVNINEDLAKENDYERKYLPILRDRLGALHNW